MGIIGVGTRGFIEIFKIGNLRQLSLFFIIFILSGDVFPIGVHWVMPGSLHAYCLVGGIGSGSKALMFGIW